jgi:hypothetical protein
MLKRRSFRNPFSQMHQTTVPQKSQLNALPTIPHHVRPTSRVFVWGTGNFGQFGMGSNRTGEYGKPQQNMLVENMIESGDFGEGLGGEYITSGGIHTIFVNERGRVGFVAIPSQRLSHIYILLRYGPAVMLSARHTTTSIDNVRSIPVKDKT